MKCPPNLLSVAGLALLVAVGSASWAQLPPSKGAPQVGQKAPDFTALDLSGKPVKLSELSAAPLPVEPRPAGKTSAAKKAPWGLLIFYRGYW